LSARKLSWAPDIDGEIYINDNEINEKIKFGKIYTARVTELSGDKLIATIIK
ncbi:MAG: 30S ribosomal protein S12 methylthiotransferase RimO, partial [Campylobacterota bacterium]|nr:30S ribosomal protein S12 methylthiotransferase RimO [Campylobacterota bacterium]